VREKHKNKGEQKIREDTLPLLSENSQAAITFITSKVCESVELVETIVTGCRVAWCGELLWLVQRDTCTDCRALQVRLSLATDTLTVTATVTTGFLPTWLPLGESVRSGLEDRPRRM